MHDQLPGERGYTRSILCIWLCDGWPLELRCFRNAPGYHRLRLFTPGSSGPRQYHGRAKFIHLVAAQYDCCASLYCGMVQIPLRTQTQLTFKQVEASQLDTQQPDHLPALQTGRAGLTLTPGGHLPILESLTQKPL